jgi:hypothetical protein
MDEAETEENVNPLEDRIVMCTVGSYSSNFESLEYGLQATSL